MNVLEFRRRIDEVAKIRGRQEGPRRPSRSKKSGFLGRSKGMKDKWLSKTPVAKDIPKADPEPWKTKPITEFEGSDDWILSMILVALMHANPDMTPEEAVKAGKDWAKKLAQPRQEHRWKKQTVRISRSGIRAEASKIRRELYKMI